MSDIQRRQFLATSAALALPAVSPVAMAQERSFNPQPGDWRTFAKSLGTRHGASAAKAAASTATASAASSSIVKAPAGLSERPEPRLSSRIT